MDFSSTKKPDTEIMAAFKRWHSKYKRYKKQIPSKMRYRIILHYGLFKIVWDWFILSLVLYTAVEVPFVSSFILPRADDTNKSDNATVNIFENIKRRYPDAYPVLYTDMVIDILFMIDILINFRTTYVKSGEHLITNPWKIALHYLKTYFLVDFVAAIPWELMVSLNAETEEQNSMLFSLLKTARLLRLFRAARKLDRNYEYMTSLLFLMLMFFMLVAHWMACIWYAIGNTEYPQQPGSWLNSFAFARTDMDDTDPFNGLSVKSRYLCSLYFVMTLCSTVGFGNVAAVTDGELIFCICCMLIGAVMHAAIFGNVTAIIHGQYSSNFRYRKESQQIHEFIRYFNIKNPLARRLREFSRHTWSQTKGTDMPKVLKKFPEGLQYEIQLHMHLTVLLRSSLFRDFNSSCLRDISMKTRLQHHLPNHFITYEGDDVDSLRLVRRGKIDVLVSESSKPPFQICEGDAFGANLKQVKQRGSKAIVSLRAENCVDCHVIKLSDLEDILESYPNERTQLMTMMDSADQDCLGKEQKVSSDVYKVEGNGIHPEFTQIDDVTQTYICQDQHPPHVNRKNLFPMKLLKKKATKTFSKETESSVLEDVETSGNSNKYTSMSSESFALEGRGRFFNITKLSRITGYVQTSDNLQSPGKVCRENSDIEEEDEIMQRDVEDMEIPLADCIEEDFPAREDLSEDRYKELSTNIQRLESKFETLIALLQQGKLNNSTSSTSASADNGNGNTNDRVTSI